MCSGPVYTVSVSVKELFTLSILYLGQTRHHHMCSGPVYTVSVSVKELFTLSVLYPGRSWTPPGDGGRYLALWCAAWRVVSAGESATRHVACTHVVSADSGQLSRRKDCQEACHRTTLRAAMITGGGCSVVQCTVCYCSCMSTTPGNLLEFEIAPGNTGNLPEFSRCSWKIL